MWYTLRKYKLIHYNIRIFFFHFGILGPCAAQTLPPLVLHIREGAPIGVTGGSSVAARTGALAAARAPPWSLPRPHASLAGGMGA